MNDILKVLKKLIPGFDENDTATINALKVLIEYALLDFEIETGQEELDIDDLPRGVESILVDMVLYRFNTLGKEGISSESIAEISNSYDVEYPPRILRRIKRFRVLKVW